MREHQSFKGIIKFANSLGYTATMTKNCHLKFTHPALPKPVYASSTPSDNRARKNAEKQLERMLRNVV